MGKEKITKKEIMYEVGRDIGKVGERVYSSTFGPVFGYLNKDVKNVGKDVIKVACKATYPILGNMSNNVQTKLENLLGKEYYNAEHAFNTSVVSNLPLYVSPLFIGKILDKAFQSRCNNLCRLPHKSKARYKIPHLGQ